MVAGIAFEYTPLPFLLRCGTVELGETPVREVLLSGRLTTLHGDPSYGKMLITRVGQGCLHDESVLWKDVDHAVNNYSWVVPSNAEYRFKG